MAYSPLGIGRTGVSSSIMLPVARLRNMDTTSMIPSGCYSAFLAPYDTQSDKMYLRDNLSLNNRRKREEAEERKADRQAEAKTVTDPLAPASHQGHEPSRGAKIDAELQADDEANLSRKQQQKELNGPNV